MSENRRITEYVAIDLETTGLAPYKERIIENLDSANVELTDEEFAALEDALNGLKVYGHRGLGGF